MAVNKILETHKSPSDFVDTLEELISDSLPKEGLVMSYSTGVIEATEDKPAIPYASFVCCDPEEYQLYSTINRESQTPSFVVKIQKYSNQKLDSFLGQTIDLSSAKLVFQNNRFGQPVGFKLSTSI